mgnify:CR=1 FL=1
MICAVPDTGQRQRRSAIPPVDNPFFVVTPPFTRTSAGVTVLHLLCHYLNAVGENAFIVHYPPAPDPGGGLSPNARLQICGEFPGGMNAPLITQDVLDFYNERRITPVVIYPEILDNPFSVSFFARYLLNYPGLLGPHYSQRAIFEFAYSKHLATGCNADDVLFIPTADLSFWNSDGASPIRSGTCFYAGKLQEIFGKKPQGLPTGSVEILRSSAMSRQEIRLLFWTKEAFYCFEDTSLATEATLCGCPTVFVANDHFSGIPLANLETTMDGACLYDEPSGLTRAKETVGNCECHILRSIAKVPLEVSRIAHTLKAHVQCHPFTSPFNYPFQPRLVLLDNGDSPDLLQKKEPLPQFAWARRLFQTLRGASS